MLLLQIFASDSFLELTEYTREEILGRNCRYGIIAVKYQQSKIQRSFQQINNRNRKPALSEIR